ncbi:MAG: hypothetical protein HY691_19070, partial [Chloroflexi bacterium]|nr:hypothetical protein [Chloroflexota bacterium]
MLDVVIRGGQVVTPEGVGSWDVAIQGEQIVALAAPGTLTGDVGRLLDATGKLVIPGGIDPHVHTRWSLDGGKTFLGAPPGPVSRAALHGGTTTLVDFAIWQGSGTVADVIAEKEAAWRESHADYALHIMLLGTLPHEIIEQVPEAISAGFPSLKIFMTNTTPLRHGRMVDMGRIWALMQHCAR